MVTSEDLDALKPSALLRLAVGECRKFDALIAKDPKHGWDMNVWWSRGDDKCLVCMAGAIMHNMDIDDPEALWACTVNAMRMGIFDEVDNKAIQSLVEDRFSRFLKKNREVRRLLPSTYLTWDQYDKLSDLLKANGY